MAQAKEIPENQPQAENISAEAVPDSGVDDELRGIESSIEARGLAMLIHLLGLVGFLGPLIIWMNEKDKHRFVAEHGRAAMNYQVSLVIYYAISAVLTVACIGVILLPALTIAHVIFVIMGAVKANRGQRWKYPIAIEFLK